MQECDSLFGNRAGGGFQPPASSLPLPVSMGYSPPVCLWNAAVSIMSLSVDLMMPQGTGNRSPHSELKKKMSLILFMIEKARSWAASHKESRPY